MKPRIGLKLLAGFMLIFLLMGGLALYAKWESETTLREATGQRSVSLAREILQRVEGNIGEQIEALEQETYMVDFQEALEQANQQTADLAARKKRDKEWIAARPDALPLWIREILSNRLSQFLRHHFIQFHLDKYGHAPFSELLVTDRFGTVVAATGLTTDYRQEDEPWWRQAREHGSYRGPVRYDMSARIHGFDLAFRIEDGTGRFMGVIKAVLNYNKLLQEAEAATGDQGSGVIHLISEGGRLLFRSTTFRFFENVGDRPFVRKTRGRPDGFFTYGKKGSERLYAFASSSREENGMGWTLLVSQDVDEVLRPSRRLGARILTAALFLMGCAILAAYLLTRSITLPLERLRRHFQGIGASDLGPEDDDRLPPGRQDEIGELTEAANQMSTRLSQTQVELQESIQRLQEEVEERERAQRALLRSEERLQLAIQGANDGLWDWYDLKEDLVWWSPRLFELLGYEPGAFQPSFARFQELLHPDDREAAILAVTAHLEKRVPYDMEFRVRVGPDAYRWFQARGQGLWDMEGKPFRMSGAFQDIHDRKMAEEEIHQLNEALEARVKARTSDLQHSLDELERAQSQLVESEKMASLGSLVAGVAHEINTPLGIGVTASTFLESKTRDFIQLHGEKRMKRSDLEAFVKTAEESSQLISANLLRAARLVRSFKQVAVDQTSQERRTFKVHDFLESVLVSLQPQLKERPIHLNLHCPDDLEIDSVPGAWAQILTNLVINSLTHGFEGKEHDRIDLILERSGELVRFTYRDNGKGMTEAVQKRIFDPFFTTRRGEGGAGLGMHIVFNLVTQALGGRITCESKPGEGTLFHLLIPAAPGNEPAP